MSRNEELKSAQTKAAELRAKWLAAKGNAKREAAEALEFWTNKVAMLDVMVREGV
jgi:hypothetical protein